MVEAFAARASRQLARARTNPTVRAALPVLLSALQADAHLAALRRAGWNPTDPRINRRRPRPLALMWAHWRGRI
jgi:hypothetical protein